MEESMKPQTGVPGKPPDASICLYGRRILHRHALEMRQEVEGVRQAKDIEAIHRMRVASRRLRTALELFEECLPPRKSASWKREIRYTARALSLARDLDVQLEVLKNFSLEETDRACHAGLKRLLLRKQQKRAKLQKDVLEALKALEDEAALQKLAARCEPLPEEPEYSPQSTPAVYALANEWIQRRLDEMLKLEEFIIHPECVAELHQMRIAAKRLRYTLETFAPLYGGHLDAYIQALRSMQTLLGDIHDCDVWLETLPAFIEKESQRALHFYGSEKPFRRILPGLLHFQENRHAERVKTYRQFVEKWGKWQETRLWDRLRVEMKISGNFEK